MNTLQWIKKNNRYRWLLQETIRMCKEKVSLVGYNHHESQKSEFEIIDLLYSYNETHFQGVSLLNRLKAMNEKLDRGQKYYSDMDYWIVLYEQEMEQLRKELGYE